jgi:hypothetical protein
MDTAVLTTLLFNTAGILVFAVGMVLAYCMPNRHRIRPWVAVDNDAATRPAATVAQNTQVDARVDAQVDATELPHAA